MNIPLLDAIANMLNYTKFLKELVSNNKLEEYSTVPLIEEFCIVIQREFSLKLNSSGSFSIPIVIRGAGVEMALYDLLMSINLMPMSSFRRLGLRKLKLCANSLQLVDRSVKYPQGKI